MKHTLSRSIIILLLIVLAALSASQIFAQAQTPEELCAAAPTDEPLTRQFTEPEQVIEEGIDYHAIFCTSAGPVYVDLYEDFAPITVNSFVFLAQNGYFNNTTFHRVIADFMAQGGDPTGTGTGGPGYAFEDEFSGFLHFDQPGLLAMANAGPGTNGSQFFITTSETPHLDYRHTIFGRVLEGQENVEAIELRDPSTATAPGTTLDTVLIVTDPSTVAVDTPARAPADQAMFEAAISEISALMGDPLALNAEATGIQSTELVVASAPSGDRASVEALLSDNGHEYRVSVEIDNVGCDTVGVPFVSLGYTIDVFTDAASAEAVASSETLITVLENMGYSAQSVQEFEYPLFTRQETLCDTSVTHALTFYPLGRMLTTASITFIDDGSGITAAEYVEFISALNFERFFSTPLRAELG